MKLTDKPGGFLRHPFFSDYRTLFFGWILLAIAAWLINYFPGTSGTFRSLTSVCGHAAALPLLSASAGQGALPYGLFFSLVIAPLASLPSWAGFLATAVFLTIFFFLAVRLLPLNREQHIFIYWFCAYALFATLSLSLFSVATIALLMATFVCVEKSKDAAAAFFLMLGAFIDPAALSGLIFICLSKHKIRFFGSALLWGALLFAAPMAFTSPSYLVGQYKNWYAQWIASALEHVPAGTTDLSLPAFVSGITGAGRYAGLYTLLGGLGLLLLPSLRVSQYKYAAFRQSLAASLFLFIALFRLQDEPGTCLTALTGAALWYVAAPWQHSKWDVCWMVAAFFLSGVLSSPFLPAFIRETYIAPYALSLWPCLIIWLKLSGEMCIRDYYGRHDYFR